jgi:hypothetical protein
MSRGKLVQLALPLDIQTPGVMAPYLWPDKNGLLTLPGRWSAPSNVSRLRHWRPSPRRGRAGVRSLPRSLSLRLWLSWRSGDGCAHGWRVEKRFEGWLSSIVESADFQVIPVGGLVLQACADLALDAEVVRRLLVRLTSRTGKFEVVDGLVMLANK